MINKLSRKFGNGETYTIEQNSEYPGSVEIRHNGDYVTSMFFSELLITVGIDLVRREQSNRSNGKRDL
uniref:Uncharacterized protein n=1 Tax=viral metagenome TaxID=1070528 RepID=A0A6M3LT10_9ZZZZ